jgi:hypothetical protein
VRETVEAGHESLRSGAIPPARVEIPAARATELRVRGGWWRPRLERATSTPGALGLALPGGRVVLHRPARARELVADVELARADAALLAAPSLR